MRKYTDIHTGTWYCIVYIFVGFFLLTFFEFYGTFARNLNHCFSVSEINYKFEFELLSVV